MLFLSGFELYSRWVPLTYGGLVFTVGESPPNISGKIKDNSKLNNGGLNKWLVILAGKDLQTKLRNSESVDFKFSVSNGTAKANTVNIY